ncbi:MAG: GNAT family N-acetyltransferase [Minisyncoccia bacterium]|jgi:GNAT superfamily N-acetyltransferase
MHKQEIAARGTRFSINKDGREVARGYLYLLTNDLHAEPFGLVEDVYVDEKYRSLNLGRELLAEIISEARHNKCYKLIATSRNDGTRQAVHDWYVRLGFRNYGTEFRMEL